MTTVYQTATMGEARVRVALVERGSADLLVHRVGSRGLAHGDAARVPADDELEPGAQPADHRVYRVMNTG